MNPLTTLITILFLSLVSSPGWGEEMKDLVEREGIYYKKFTDVPFTGEVGGHHEGFFKSGKKDGRWVAYHESKSENPSRFKVRGPLGLQTNYKNGKKEGAWVRYYENGQLQDKGTFKNNQRDGSWVEYWPNGQLLFRGYYKSGIPEGTWVAFEKNGQVLKSLTGTFKNGTKID